MENNKNTGYPSIDKPWLQFYDKGVENYHIPDISMYQLMDENTKDYENYTALTYFDKKIKFDEFKTFINRYAKCLKSLNINSTSCVLLMLPQIPEMRELIYASNIIGATVFPITPMIAPAQLNNIINENEINTIFIFDKFLERYTDTFINNNKVKNIIPLDGTESLPKIISFLSRLKKNDSKEMLKKLYKKVIPWNEFDSLNVGDNITPYFEKNKTAAIISTSGTSGIPSCVAMTNEAINAMALQHLNGSLNYEKGDKNLDDLIPSIAYGFSVMHYSSVLAVNSILVPNMETDVMKLLKKYNPDHFVGGPIHYEILTQRIKKGEKKPMKGKNFVSGGASLTKDIEMFLNEVTIDYLEPKEGADLFVRLGYGCTENGGAATYAKKGSYKSGSIGIPLPYEVMSIFKPGTDEELKYGNTGEICISGPTVMKEYINNPELTSKILITHSDGKIWLHTKDLGFCDEDGRFYIIDRIKNIFMRNGHNVHPSWMREMLLRLPYVDDCCVVGIKHPAQQNVPVVFIKFKDEITNIEETKKEIINYCEQNFDDPSIPYDFIIVDNIPHNMGGKIDERYLIKASGIDYSNNDEKYNNGLVKVKKINFEK